MGPRVGWWWPRSPDAIDNRRSYPYTDAMMKKCGNELAGRTTGKGTIRFTATDPLPAALVTKLVKIRMAEIDEGDG
jgi:uncharacterized protein YdhG (YjbR/CyaY superfamily)